MPEVLMAASIKVTSVLLPRVVWEKFIGVSARTSETSVSFYQTTWGNSLEENNFKSKDV
jgi:hypothetical protein